MVPVEIVSVEYAGEQEVWDIETEEHHTFFANGIAVHNCQLFDPGLEIEVLEVLNDSRIKSVFYAGTSTTTETLLETRFQEGTQGFWQILKDNGQVLDCGDAEQVMAHIGPKCLLDPDTGNKIDPLRGYYKFNNPIGFADRQLSIHVPQIINPDIANDPLEWSGVYKTMLRDQNKFIQEKLGIALEEASREVTKKDLQNICRVPFGVEERKQLAREGYYRFITSGFDWGGSDYNPMLKTKISTTVHTIVGVSPDDKLHVLWARRHSGMDYKSIFNLLLGDHMSFCAGAMASDFGGGQQYHSLIRSHPNISADRHVIFRYDDPESPICRPLKESALPNAFSLNRTESLTALYMAIVMSDPIIQCPPWAEFEEYLQDFLNLTRVLTDKGDGRTFRYNRHGSKPDDFVHALNMAYSLIRLSMDQSLIHDPNSRAIIRGAVQGGDMVGQIFDPWSSALSSYARETDRFD